MRRGDEAPEAEEDIVEVSSREGRQAEVDTEVEDDASESYTESSGSESSEVVDHEHGTNRPGHNESRPRGEVFDAFEVAERRQNVMGELQQARVRQERTDTIKLEEELHRWSEQCALCVIRGEAEVLHSFDACSQPDVVQVRERCRLLGDGFKYESYTACYGCGIPQAICRRWVRGTKHKFAQQAQVRCQFRRHFHTVLVVVVSDFGSREMVRMLREWIREEDGVSSSEDNERIELQ